MTVGEFWDKQEFAYLVTYSFNRGPKLAEAIQQAKQELKTARFMQLPAIQRRIETLEKCLGKLTEGLDDWNVTAIQVAEIPSHSGAAQQLATICAQTGMQDVYAACRPIYRDALAFYDKQGKLMRVLNICFECNYMATDSGEHIEADAATYQHLGIYLAQLGHPIENF